MAGDHRILKRVMIAVALMAVAALGVGIASGFDSLQGTASQPAGTVQVAAQNPPAASPPPAASQPVAPAAPPPAAQATIPKVVVVRLIRSALIALGHANDTGDYTVLRALGTPDFQQKNSVEDLARIFAPSRGIDVGAAAVVEPVIASVDSDGQDALIIKGSLPLQPTPADFVVIYRPVNKVWRLFGLSLVSQPPQAAAQPAPGPAPAQ